MTTAPATSVAAATARQRSRAEQRAYVAFTMASAAISIDLVLPAFARIRQDFGLPAGSSATAGLITAFFLGLASGPVPFGLAADRFGRRAVLRVSCALFVAGALASAIAPSLVLIKWARFAWGLGASGLRVVSTATIRDRHRGAEMARELAFVMTIFILVPVFAPLLGAGIIRVVPWRGSFVFCALFGLGLALWSVRIPETLAVDARQPLRLRQVGVAARELLTHRVTLCYTVALMVMFGVFASYLASSERMVGDVFGHRSLFPLVFGVVAIAMGATSLAVGRTVERVGLDPMIRRALVVYVLASIVLYAIARPAGRPSFVGYFVVLTVVLATQQVVISNMNAAAMVPVGHVAATAAALLAMGSTAAGAILGAVIDGRFDGTVRPFSTAQVVTALAVVALVVAAQARRLNGVAAPVTQER